MLNGDRIQAREGVLATPKHLHVITTTRGNFPSKICKRGGGRREIEWGEGERRRRRPRRSGHGEEDERWKGHSPYLYPGETDTTGTTSGKAPVLPVRSTAADRRREEINYRWYRWLVGTTGQRPVLPVTRRYYQWFQHSKR
jgi:hypothetical protein